MKIEKTTLDGCYLLTPLIRKDERGLFVKTFNYDTFNHYGLETSFKEQYYSYSHQGVLRGLHFQLPPHDHVKLVYCLSGKIIDVVVDIRKSSPTYGKYEIFELNKENGKMVYIPSGMAHGFYVVSKSATLVYNVSSIYSSDYDSGIRWDSVGIPWPTTQPIVSKKDKALIEFLKFESPFD